MKKIVLIILIILCLFIPIIYVYSYEEGDSPVTGVSYDGVGGSSGQSMDSASSSTQTSYSGGIYKGIRISFVTSDGEQLYSDDYMLQQLSGDDYYYTYPCNKVSRIKGKCSFSWRNDFMIKSTISHLEKYSTVTYMGKTYKFNINYRGAISNNSFSGLFSPLNRKPDSSMTEEEYKGVLSRFFNKMILEAAHVSLGKYMIKSSDGETPLYDVFLVYEPIAVVKINGKKYVGTAYELAKLAEKNKGGGFTDKCSGETALCDLSSALKRLMPCTSYLTGNLPEKMKELGATSLLGKFSSNSYFGSAISIKYGTASSTCSTYNKNFSDELVTGNAGIGMGVLWLSGITLEDDGGGGGNPIVPPVEEEKLNCTPKYNIGTCIDGDSISYLDASQGVISKEYWDNCVFEDKGEYDIETHKEANKNSAMTYYEPSLGSQYCEVYCIENLTTSFASGDITVEAGSRFMWGYSYATGGRTCKTKSVNWNLFTSQLNTANDNIIKSYVNWKIEENREDALANNVSVIGDCGCANTSPNGVSCCTADRPVYSTCNGLTGAALSACESNPPVVGYECIPGAQNNEKITKYYTSWSGYTVNGKYYSGSSESWCGDAKPTANVAGTQAQYNSAVSYAEGLVQAMKKCYTWDENSIYNTNPEATITYSDSKNYNYSGKLDTSTSYSLSNNSVCISQNVNQIKGCDGNSCPSTSVAMQNCSGNDRYVEMTRNAEIVFSLNDDIYRYVLKSNNLSIHRFELPKYTNSNFTTNYYDVGESNFPVSYSIPDGLYGSMHGRGNLDLTYSNLGHLKAGQTKTDVDNILSTAESSNYGKWQCEFTVYSNLIPDSSNPNGGGNGLGGIRVVYRTIDLVDPFPDIDGSKRNTGSNWCSFDGDCSYNNNVVKAYINNNRGVSDYDIYSGEPMYTFILTPSIIKEIRKYNSTNSYAEYTGSLAGKNYDYKCNGGSSTGKYCISDYLSYLINITGAKDQPGSCVDDKYRNYNDTGNFNACRY